MIVLFTRYHISQGMVAEKNYAREKGILIYEAEELTREVLDDIKYTILDYEVKRCPDG